MQIRSFRGSGEPAWVNASLNACEGLGPDPRIALGPAATSAAQTGRTRDRTRPICSNVRKFLPGRRPHVTQSGVAARRLVQPINASEKSPPGFLAMDDSDPDGHGEWFQNNHA